MDKRCGWGNEKQMGGGARGHVVAFTMIFVSGTSLRCGQKFVYYCGHTDLALRIIGGRRPSHKSSDSGKGVQEKARQFVLFAPHCSSWSTAEGNLEDEDDSPFTCENRWRPENTSLSPNFFLSLMSTFS